MNVNDFSGAKLAVVIQDQVLAFLRDDRAGIPFPGLWDLPGGGRELDESPVECAVRETFEETGVVIDARCITWRRAYRNERPGGLAQWFMVAEPGWLVRPALRLGNEGQAVRWMPMQGFLDRGDAIPHLQERLGHYLAERVAGA
jgi:8-oxo-dGTP diphosphatase